jgi:hypothetical protein
MSFDKVNRVLFRFILIKDPSGLVYLETVGTYVSEINVFVTASWILKGFIYG